jgi:hypothetical protein
MKAWQQLAAMAPPLAAGIFSESSYQSKFEKRIRTLEVGWSPQVLYSLLCNSGLYVKCTQSASQMSIVS